MSNCGSDGNQSVKVTAKYVLVYGPCKFPIFCFPFFAFGSFSICIPLHLSTGLAGQFNSVQEASVEPLTVVYHTLPSLPREL